MSDLESGKEPFIYVFAQDSLAVAYAMEKGGGLPKAAKNVLVLNCGDYWKPGGQYLDGSPAQEESLCARSLLYFHLNQKQFYRTTTFRGRPALDSDEFIYSKDVMVTHLDPHAELPSEDKFYIDVVTVPALFHPATKIAVNEYGFNEEVYANQLDKVLMRNKIRSIMRLAASEKHEYIVLAALGCGVWKNPPGEIAKIFHEVLTDTNEYWPSLGIKKVVIPIFDTSADQKTWSAFENAFSSEPLANIDEFQDIYSRWMGDDDWD